VRRDSKRIMAGIALGALLGALWRLYSDQVVKTLQTLQERLYGHQEPPDEDSVAYQLDQTVSDFFRGGKPDLEPVEASLPGTGLVIYAVDEVTQYMPRRRWPWQRNVEQQ
jgi:hypothetical protein